jgi:hypothetical protein
MTNQELNRDIKRLVKNCGKLNAVEQSTPEFTKAFEACNKEFRRLYGADGNFSAMTRQNILYMLRLNVRHRFIGFHQFGLMINLPNE